MNPLRPFQIPLSGINLIEASAGTGKTYNIASLYIRSLIELEIEVKDILVVTYTEAATKELRERLMRRLRESVQSLEGKEIKDDEFLQKLPGMVSDSRQAISKLQNAIRSFDEAAIYTIHGFCYQALQEQAFESRALFEAELAGNDKEIVRQVIDDYWRKWVYEVTEDPKKRPLLQYLMDKGYDPDTLTNELSGFVGKPYLEIRSEIHEEGQWNDRLDQLAELFQKLKDEWRNNREEIFSLLDAGHLSYYRTDWLQGWMVQMHEWISMEVPPIELFDKFERFMQSYIDNSLKKAPAKKGITPPQHLFFKIADQYQTIAESLNSFDKTFKLRLFYHLLEALDIQKEEQQVLSYDDLLIRLRNALVHSERGKRLSAKLCRAYPVALVDEFQDTDPIQYEIFKTIYGDREEDASLFMIGDPKQSIYSFRGADIFAYLKAKQDVPGDKIYSLSRNFRSIPELLSAVNRLFGYRENPFILEDIPFQPVEPGKEEQKYARLKVDGNSSIPIEFRELQNPSDELPMTKGEAQQRCARDTATQIAELLKKSSDGNARIGNKRVKAADIAVLVRSHFQAGLVRDALRSKGINSVQYSQDSVFESDEAEELQFVLKAVAEPANEGFVKTALATPIMGYNANDLVRFEEDESAWVAKLEQFSEWHTLWQKHGFSYMFRRLLKDENIPEKIMKRSDGERKLTNLVHLSELLQQKERGGKTGTRSLLQWLARKRNEEQKDQEEEQLRLESDENLVKVVTMHRSKGLEYPIVFCPFLWHGPEYSDSGKPIVYHDTEDPSKAWLDFHGKSDPERNEKRFRMAQEELAESVRLAYVAVTRAEQKCVISWAQASRTEYSPLGYLLLGQEESFKVLEQAISSDGSYSSVSPQNFRDTITKLVEGSPDLFAVARDTQSGPQQLMLSAEEKNKLEVRSFQRENELKAGLSISSFSSLTLNKEVEFETDYDLYSEEYDKKEIINAGEQGLTTFNFPKGPNPGTAVHHIFEQIDFTDLENLTEVIAENLDRHNIDQKWIPIVSKMVTTALSKTLRAEDTQLKMAAVGREHLIAELEFYFTSGEAQLRDLLEIIRPGKAAPPSAAGYSEKGFMKGFIDLIFEHDERYYILDYKTNHLGNEISDYGAEYLEREMKAAMYDLQYHIYILALHRFLADVLPEYTYDRNFGGVFYLFLRGINRQGEEGIYFDRPEFGLIEKLDRYLQRRREHG